MLIVLPFWTSFLLRVYAWIGLLKNNGVINNVLLSLGVIDQPLALLQTDFAVYIGIVYSYLPFMILPLYANLEKHDPALLEAAADLGARPFRAFLRVTLPQSLPGILAGSLLVFIPAVGEYVIPTLLGRTDQLMIGRVLSDEFFENRDWPVASAVAILILLLLVMPIMLFQRVAAARAGGQRSEVARPVRAYRAGARADLPVRADHLDDRVLLQQLAPGHRVGRAPTRRRSSGTARCVHNGQILGAAWLSIRIALVAATGAVILGTLAGMALARFGAFRGRTLLAGMTTAPIVMPEVITGLSLLLLFVALEQLIGWPKGVGAVTITLAHITFCMAYVTVVVQSRLVGFDESLEEAAMDLGARPAEGVLPHHAAADPAGDRLGLAAGVHAVLG